VTSAQPTEVVRRLFEARRLGDVRSALALMHDDISALSVADGREYHGVEEVRAAFLEPGADGRRVEVDAHRLHAHGDDVVVHGRIRVVERGSLVDSPAAWRFPVREGRVSRIEPAPAERPVAAA